MTWDADVATRTAPRRRGAFVVGFLTLCAFGPYVSQGFRTEQLAVYSTAFVLATRAHWIRVRPSRAGILAAALLGVELLIAAIGAADPPLNTTRYQPGLVLAGLDNLLLPVAVIVIIWMILAAGGEPVRLVGVTCTVTVWAMVVNAGLATAAASGSGPDLTMFQGQADVETVAYRAEQLGRYSGIFNQPAEAGLMYSIALIAAIYLYRRRPVVLALVATALCAGGVLTVSKIFLFIGVPACVWQILRLSGRRQRLCVAVAMIALAVWAAGKSGLAPEWVGQKYLLRLLPGSSQGVVDLYTAGRLGGDSTLTVVTDAVLKASPVWGLGAGGLVAPYDNAWVEALVMAGVFGVAIFTALLIILGVSWWRMRREHGNDDLVRLSGGLVAVVVGGAVGVPSLTVNRCSTIAWLLVSLLLLSRRTAAVPPVADRGGGPTVVEQPVASETGHGAR